MSSSQARFVPNPFADYDGQESLTSPSDSGALREDLAKPITEAAFADSSSSLLGVWERNFAKDLDGGRDQSVYTGIAGSALLYLKLAEGARAKQGSPVAAAECLHYLQKAASLVDLTLGGQPARKRGYGVPTFLCGEVGLQTVAALLEAKLRRGLPGNGAEELLNRIAAHAPSVLDLDHKMGRSGHERDLPDELLYGRAGYLYALLLLRRELARDDPYIGSKCAQILPDQLIRSVVQAILDSGLRTAAQRPDIPSPLVYFWHGSPYVGAAHGYAGIAYLLLQARAYLTEQQLRELVKPMIDFVCSLRFPGTDNFPSSMGEDKTDKLVHWCHGSPGVVYMLATASEVFGAEGEGRQYAEIALKAGEDIWTRGLLKKGYGLCHGAAGNAYAFLRLYQLSGGRDSRWLYRAVKFAEWCSLQYGRHEELGVRTNADRPYSLFEGLAGTLHFLVDIQRPLEARFPAFQLD